MPDTIYQNPRPAGRKGEVVVTSTCGHNCGGRCVVNAHVVDGRIVRISTDPRALAARAAAAACLRPRLRPDRALYHPDRLKHPLRRTGPRGSGPVRAHLVGRGARRGRRARCCACRDQYGNAAILDASRSGSLSALHGRGVAQRFLYMFGGCTELWSNMSAEAEIFAVRMTFGAKADYKSAGREPTDYVNSKLILMWGWSPADGTFGTGTYQYLKEAKKQGVRIVCVDPAADPHEPALADEHIFIQPSTDAAALIAMAYVIVSEGLHDQAYCDRHVLGFDEDAPAAGRARAARPTVVPAGRERRRAEDARMGRRAITGIPAETIRRLAIEFATTKPAALQCGYAPGPHRLRRAVPPRRLCARGDHRQCRHRRRQLRRQQRRHRPHRHQEPAGRHQPDRRRGSRRRCWPTCWRAARRAAIRPTSS